MKYISVLGSTGSIGQSALAVIKGLKKYFRVLSLSTNSNIDILYRQVKEFRPQCVCVRDISAGRNLEKKLGFKTKLFLGEGGLAEIIRDKKIDKIVVGISGSAALLPLLEAIDRGCDIALANKEALVMAGPLIMQKAKARGVKIIPVDSEQSAIWQCLAGEEQNKIKNIYLTASGGPFRKSAPKDLRSASVKRVLRHPRWKMGKKISVDSATLMNKGLELIEAIYLFGLTPDKIKILIHPEAIIHSMVEFVDGVVMAQLSATDMRIPIQYALTYPNRLGNTLPAVDFYRLKSFNFEKPDFKKFPCLSLAYRAAEEGGTVPCVLNAANEVSVAEFLKERLPFIAIPRVIEKVMAAHRKIKHPDLSSILEADAWARSKTSQAIKRMS